MCTTNEEQQMPIVEAENSSTLMDNNPFKYINSLEDVMTFVEAIGEVSRECDEIASASYDVLRLLWVTAAYVREEVMVSEHTIDSMRKILYQACTPTTDRDDPSAFDIMIDACSNDTVKMNYAYFKYRTFGTHSNYYKKILADAKEILDNTPQEQVCKKMIEVQSAKGASQEAENKPLFGKLTQKTGQALQIELYEKRLTAVHEAGHAVAHYLLHEPFEGVDIIPADEGLGCVYISRISEVDPNHNAIILFAGMAAQDAIFNLVYSRIWGGSDDACRATKIIKDDVVKKVSNPGDAQKYVYIDADVLGLAEKESPYIVYETIKRCVELRQVAVRLVESHKDMIEALAEELLKKNSMASEEVVSFLDEYTARTNKSPAGTQ